MAGWLQRAGARLARHEMLPPPDATGLTVSIWLAEKLPEAAGHRSLARAEREA
jgi:hypothetical protein